MKKGFILFGLIVSVFLVYSGVVNAGTDYTERGYEIDCTAPGYVLCDDFEDDSINTSLWDNQGSIYSESDGFMKFPEATTTNSLATQYKIINGSDNSKNYTIQYKFTCDGGGYYGELGTDKEFGGTKVDFPQIGNNFENYLIRTQNYVAYTASSANWTILSKKSSTNTIDTVFYSNQVNVVNQSTADTVLENDLYYSAFLYNDAASTGCNMSYFMVWEGNLEQAPYLPPPQFAPSIDAINITPLTPDVGNNLSCSVQISDANLDTMDLGVNWFKNNELQTTHETILTNLYDGTYLVNLSYTETLLGENWSCNGYVTDGTLISANLTADNVTIVNTPPTYRNFTTNYTTYYLDNTTYDSFDTAFDTTKWLNQSQGNEGILKTENSNLYLFTEDVSQTYANVTSIKLPINDSFGFYSTINVSLVAAGSPGCGNLYSDYFITDNTTWLSVFSFTKDTNSPAINNKTLWNITFDVDGDEFNVYDERGSLHKTISAATLNHTEHWNVKLDVWGETDNTCNYQTYMWVEEFVTYVYNTTRIPVYEDDHINATVYAFDLSPSKYVLELCKNDVCTNSTPKDWESEKQISELVIADAENITIRYWLNDSSNQWNYTTWENFTVDWVSPTTTFNPTNFFSMTNNSNIKQYGQQNGTINFTFKDENNIFGYMVNITKDGTQYYGILNLSVGSNETTLSKVLDNYNWPVGVYDINIVAADGHTKKEISDYHVEKAEKFLMFRTPEGNDINIEAEDALYTEANKEKDRYTFGFYYPSEVGIIKKPKTELVYKIKSNKYPIYYVEDSSYIGHFVIWNSDTNEGNWIDFESDALKGMPDLTYEVNKLNDYYYKLTFYSSDIANLKDIKYKSIGGINVGEWAYQWYKGNYTLFYSNLTNESVTEEFNLNVTYDGVFITDVSAEFYYNGGKKTVSTAPSGDAQLITATVDTTGLFNSVTLINFTYNVTVTQTNGSTYEFLVNGTQTVVYNAIDECDGSDFVYPVWNITYYDQVDYSQLDPIMSYDITYTDGVAPKTISGSFNAAFNHTFCSNLDPATSVFNWGLYGSMTLTETGYVSKIFSIPDYDMFYVNNSRPLQTPLYMIGIGNSSTITYTWLTTEYQSINGLLKIYQCNSTGEQILVESTPITSGQAIANLELLTQAYSYQVVIGGVTYTGASFTPCHVESSTERTYYVDVGAANYSSAIGLQGVFCNISKTGVDTVKMFWGENPQDSSDITGCILAYRSGISGYTLIYQNCTNTTDSIERSIPMNAFDYLIKGSLTQGESSKWCDNTVEFRQDNDTASQFDSSGLLVIVLLILSMALFYHAGGEVQLALAGVGLIAAWVLGITQFGWVTISSIMAFLIIIAMIGRHSRK